MVRALRYPRLCKAACVLTLLCALGRDACVGAGQLGWAAMLLFATVLGLAACFCLMSCRIVVDEMGVGVGFLLGMRHIAWDEFAALGALCCNSRRTYLYGMYRGSADFIHMLHRAPRCGDWGFVAPLNRRLAGAIHDYCPYPVELTPPPRCKKPEGMRPLWHQAALYALVMFPAAAVAEATCVWMLSYGAQEGASFALTLGAAAMCAAGVLLARRAVNTFLTCPFISEAGVSVGRGLYMPWEDVRFAYVQRMGRVSGLFFLSCPVSEASRLSAPPVVCLSVPDTSTLLLAYLTYCPHAPKDMQA